MAIEEILSQLGYPNRARVQADVVALQNKFNALAPKASTHIHNNGTESFLLMLEGTIPITYKRATYNIPIEVIVSEAYPSTAPLCFVRPVKGMEVKRDHRHVSMDGRVHLPYLENWRAEHALVPLAENMATAFSLQPPVFAVRQPPPPPAYQELPTSGADQSAKENGSCAASGGGGGGGSGGGGSAVETERETAIREVTEKLRRHLKEVVIAGVKETEEEYRRRARLEANQRAVDAQIEGLTGRLKDLTAALAAVTKANTELDVWLAERRAEEESQAGAGGDSAALMTGSSTAAAASSGGVGGGGGGGLKGGGGRSSGGAAAGGGGVGSGSSSGGSAAVINPLASLPVQPADPFSAKLLELVAESCAIEDTLYALDRGLMRECVSVGEFMKQVRMLSRQQFFVQAHIQKVHRAQQERQRRKGW
jgi:hypothetical protein